MERLTIGDAVESLTPHEATLRAGGTPEWQQRVTDCAQTIRTPQVWLERTMSKKLPGELKKRRESGLCKLGWRSERAPHTVYVAES